MKKKILIIFLIILIIVSIIGGVFAFLHFKKANKDDVVEVNETIDLSVYNGKRGKITETERVSFLIKGEDLIARYDGSRT